jgi:serine/threonine-protein kinase
MEFVAGSVVAGRFRLVKELGHGGMGSVWRAQDTSLDTPCAIKFIHGQAAEDAAMRARFEREAKSAAQLRSPNVVQILDHGVSDGTPYIAMELLEGEDLEHRLQRVGRMTPQETVYVMSQVGKALTRATAAGLVHRDLKPANIFLVRDDDRDIPKVLDFGVAKSTMPELADASTKTGALMGTPFYMSPEQTRGTKAIDHRSDLWALAVIVFQCVTGRLPFISDSLGDLLFKIATDPIPMPSQVAPDLPPSFDAWWTRAASRDPAQRYQTAKEFVDALALAFGLSQAGGVPVGGGTQLLGPHPHPNAPSGAGSGAWSPAAQSGAPWTPGQSGAPMAQSGGPVANPGMASAPSMQTAGVTARSINDKPEGKRGAGMIIGGAVALGVIAGGLVYVLGFRQPAAATPPPGSATTLQAPPSATAPASAAPATSATTAPAVSATATATASTSAAAPPVDSSSAKPLGKLPPGPGPGGKSHPPTPPPGHPTTAPKPPTPTIPNDGI